MERMLQSLCSICAGALPNNDVTSGAKVTRFGGLALPWFREQSQAHRETGADGRRPQREIDKAVDEHGGGRD